MSKKIKDENYPIKIDTKLTFSYADFDTSVLIAIVSIFSIILASYGIFSNTTLFTKIILCSFSFLGFTYCYFRVVIFPKKVYSYTITITTEDLKNYWENDAYIQLMQKSRTLEKLEVRIDSKIPIEKLTKDYILKRLSDLVQIEKTRTFE